MGISSSFIHDTKMLNFSRIRRKNWRQKILIEVYTDGASSGNPGMSGAVIYILASGKIYTYTFPLGMLSNHEAEFQAVLKALEICKENFPDEILSFRSDSQVVVDVIEINFTKNKQFQPLLKEINEAASLFPYFLSKGFLKRKTSITYYFAKKTIERKKKKI